MVWIESQNKTMMVNLAAVSCIRVCYQGGVSSVKAFMVGEDSEGGGWVSLHMGNDESALNYYDWLLAQLDSADINHRVVRQPDDLK